MLNVSSWHPARFSVWITCCRFKRLNIVHSVIKAILRMAFSFLLGTSVPGHPLGKKKAVMSLEKLNRSAIYTLRYSTALLEESDHEYG